MSRREKLRTMFSLKTMVGAVLACSPLGCSSAPACPIHSIEKQQPIPRVDTAPNVVLDAFHGKSSDSARVERVTKLIAEVVRNPEFDCLVLNFDQNKPLWRDDADGRDVRENCRKSPKIDELQVRLVGFRDSLCEHLGAPACATTMTQSISSQQTLTNGAIWNLFRASPYDCDGQELNKIHLAIELSGGLFHGKAIGSTGCAPNGLTQTKKWWFDQATDYEVAGHWIHEHTHRLGFCDGGVESSSPYLVSYVYGYAGCMVAARLHFAAAQESQSEEAAFSSASSEESRTRYEATCRAHMLGPGMREW